MDGGDGEPRARFRVVWTGVFVAFLVVGVAWSLGQPAFSGADEDQHATQLEAVWSGQWLPRLVADPVDPTVPGVVRVHRLADGSGCFVAQAAVPASCDRLSLERVGPVAEVRSYVSREPPLPALLTGLPLFLAPDRVGFYGSRFLTAGVAAALFATSVALALSRRRMLLAAAVVAAMTPSAVSEFGVLGSSQLETGAACLLWVTLVLVYDGEPVTARLVGLMTATTCVLANARPLSFLFVAVAYGAFAVAAGRPGLRRLWRGPGAKPAAAVSLASVGFAVGWFVLATAPLNAAYVASHHLPHITALGERVNVALGDIGVVWDQMIGASGYNEYNGPAIDTIAWTLLAGTFVGTGLLLAPRRLALAISGVAAVLFALPFVAQVVEMPVQYLFWQGRYSLPLLAGVLVLCTPALERRLQAAAARRLGFAAIAGSGLLGLLQWAATLHRFVVGTDGTLDPFAWGSGWQPPIAATVLTFLGGAVIAGAYAVLWALYRRNHEGTGLPVPSQPVPLPL